MSKPRYAVETQYYDEPRPNTPEPYIFLTLNAAAGRAHQLTNEFFGLYGFVRDLATGTLVQPHDAHIQERWLAGMEIPF